MVDSHIPLFSIIIPTYNSAQTIGVCIKSILAQSFKEFEIIFVDGASIDDTVGIVGMYTSQFPACTIVSESDTGIYDAMNKGLKLARGEWTYFLGSDDRFYNDNSLQTIANSIKDSTGVDMVYGNVMIEGDSIWANHNQVYNGGYSIEKLLKSNICHQAIFYRRAAISTLGGYNTKYPICADWDLNLKFFASRRVKHIDEIVAFFVSTGKSSVRVPDPFLNYDVVLNLKTYFGWSLFNKHFFSWQGAILKLAKLFLRTGNIAKGAIFLLAYQYHKLSNLNNSSTTNRRASANQDFLD